MLLMFEKDNRDGINHTVKHYAKANNKYMKDLYNPNKKSIYLQYVDVNKECAWAMIQNLQTLGFLRKKAEEFTPEKMDELVKKAREDIS